MSSAISSSCAACVSNGVELGVLEMPGKLSEEKFIEWTLRHRRIRCEWVDGEVVYMSPASTRHVAVFVWLVSVLSSYARRMQLGRVFGSELAVRLVVDGHIVRRVPDLIFVSQQRLGLLGDQHLEGAPDLAIEIVSPESVQRDWEEKLKEYESAGVREYWIIDLERRVLEIHGRTADERFAVLVHQSIGPFQSKVMTGLLLQTEWLWQDLPPDPVDIVLELSGQAVPHAS